MSFDGFIKLPRSLLKDPLWQSLSIEYRAIYLAIVFNAAYTEIHLDDFGKKTLIKPGQLLMTERQLINEVFPTTKNPKEIQKYKSCIHRALAKFTNMGFSNHVTNQRKTLHTILRADILALIEPNFEPNSNQTRTIKEERKERKEKKKNINISDSFVLRIRRFGNDECEVALSDDEHQKLLALYPLEFVNLCYETLYNWKVEKGKKDQNSFSDYGRILNWVAKRVVEDNLKKEEMDIRKKEIEKRKSRLSNDSSAAIKESSLLSKLEHGRFYNGCECCFDAEGVYFVRQGPYPALGVKFKEFGFDNQLENILRKLGINLSSLSKIEALPKTAEM